MIKKLKILSSALLFLLFIACVTTLKAQEKPAGMESLSPSQTSGDDDKDSPVNLLASFGYSQIAGASYVGMRFQPDLSIGKLGIGLDVPVLFNVKTWKFYDEEFKGGVGPLRLITYARWGHKKVDPVFIQIGELNNTYLGYGILVNNYTNCASYDQRKFGLSYDVLVKNFIGIEGIYSDFNFASLNLLGIRPYVKPLGLTKIPILKNIDIGLTYVTDHDKTRPFDSLDTQNNYYVRNGINAAAVDMGVMLINNDILGWRFYTQYGRLLKVKSDSLINNLNAITDSTKLQFAKKYKDGQGESVGTEFRINMGSFLTTNIRLERLFNQDYFIPQFFDVMYEIDKDKKIYNLGLTEGYSGTYGSLSFNFIKRIYVKGSLMMPDNVSEKTPAFLRLDLDASRLFKQISLTGTYTKGNIITMSDAFVIDDNSLITVNAAYKFFPWLLVGMIYQRTYMKGENGVFEPAEVYSPYVALNFKL